MPSVNALLIIAKELLIIVLLLSVIPLIKRLKYFQDSNIRTKLKLLFLCGIMLRIFYAVMDLGIFDPMLPGIENALNSSLFTFVISGFFSIATGIICMTVIFILYDLLVFRPGRRTGFLFKAFIFFSILYIFWINIKNMTGSLPPGKFDFLFSVSGENDVIMLTLGIFVSLFIVLNSFKCTWVTFLNRKEKFFALFGAIILIILLGSIIRHPGTKIIPYFSTTISSIQTIAVDFFLLYTIFASITILFHLPSAGLFDKKVTQLASLHQLSSAVASVLDIDKLSHEIVNLTADITNSDSSWLLLREDEESGFYIGAAKNVRSEDEHLIHPDSQGYLNSTIITSRTSLILNELNREYFAHEAKGSLIGIPLVSGKLGIIGILFAKKQSQYGYAEDDSLLLGTFANHAVVAIENARYFKASLEKKELENELAVAKNIQTKLLPKEIPVLPSIEIAAINLPCKEVGGDYYDIIRIDENRIGIAIADVSGKGIPASLLMANLQACLRTLSASDMTVHELTSRTNNVICENTDDSQYITFFYGIIDSREKKLRYCNAGHNPPILLRRSGSEMLLQKGGTVLGWLKNMHYEEQVVDISEGDEIIFYTDGVTEAMNPKDEEFEETRLLEIIRRCTDSSPRTIIDEILKGIAIHAEGTPQYDDLTLVIARVTLLQ